MTLESYLTIVERLKDFSTQRSVNKTVKVDIERKINSLLVLS